MLEILVIGTEGKESMSLNEFTELEYKYKADNVGLKQFTDLMEKLGYEKHLTVSSWDYYYDKPNTDDFIRFRASSIRPELTIKRKVNESNNWNRIEVDLPLDPSKINENLKKTVEEFTKLEGYSENFKIYKSCFIYWQELINYVYYIVYDEQMNTLARFIEIEFNKDKVNEVIKNTDKTTLISPRDYLAEAEKNLGVLGIGHQNRLKKSLFEMFRRVS